MIKIKASFDFKTKKFEWNYKTRKTNTLEHLCAVWNLCDEILDNTPDITEKELLDMIKNRRKYLEEIKGE